MTLIELGLVFCFRVSLTKFLFFINFWILNVKKKIFSWITPTLSSRKYIIFIKCSEYMWPRSKFYIHSSHTSVDIRNIWKTYKSTSHWAPLRISDANVLSWDWSLAFPTSSQVLILLLVVQIPWPKNHWFIYKFHCPWMIWSFLMIYDLSKAHDCQIQLFHQQFLYRIEHSFWMNFLSYSKGVTNIVYPQLK